MVNEIGPRLEAQWLWPRTLEWLQKELPREEYDQWIRPLQACTDQSALLLLAPNKHVCRRIEGAYLGRIRELVTQLDHVGEVGSVELGVGSLGAEVPGESTWPVVRDGAPAQAKAQPPADRRQPRRAGPGPGRRGVARSTLDATKRFQGFVEGPSNAVARRAALRVVELASASSRPSFNPNNPLYLYGGSGLGKTHLMYAIGNEIVARQPEAQVVFINAERFTNEMVRGIRSRNVQEVMQYYRSVQVLLVDDIHFIGGKGRTQEEFFHLFNDVLASGGQLVLSSDFLPRQVEGLEDRLRTRFAGGLTAPIGIPDSTTRMAILEEKAKAHDITIPSDVARYIVDRIPPNGRELEGAASRVAFTAQHRGQPVTLELVSEALQDLFVKRSKPATVDVIQRTVAEYYGTDLADMWSGKRRKGIVLARQMAMLFARELTSHSLPEIGERFGRRDHSTVLYSCRRIAERMGKSPAIAEDYRALRRLLCG